VTHHYHPTQQAGDLPAEYSLLLAIIERAKKDAAAGPRCKTRPAVTPAERAEACEFLRELRQDLEVAA
jgi:hypothetical protein